MGGGGDHQAGWGEGSRLWGRGTMPIFSMTRRERRLAGTVKETIPGRLRVSNA